MRKKLVIIGAGSAMFTQGLVMDLMTKNPGGCSWKLALCDTDGQVLEDIYRLVLKMVDGKDADVEVERSTDRCDLLPDADYVVTTLGVGGRRAWEQDVFIPRKYGVHQPVGDTAMPGGISRAMRMVPAMLAIARDVARLCPTARFFNYSNPMAVICRAVNRELGVPMTGLCHGTVNDERQIAGMMGWEHSRVTSLAAGINHCTFIYDFRLDGRDVLPLIRDEVLRRFPGGEALVLRSPGGRDQSFSLGEPFAWSFFLHYGAYPAPGDRHISEFFTEFFPGGDYFGRRLGHDAYSFEATIANGDRIHAVAVMAARSPEPLPESFYTRFHGEHEQLMDIIDAMERDTRRVFYMNVPHRGAVANLPPWAVVEMPAAASAAGPLPLSLPNFPDVLAAFTSRFLAGVELTVDAACRGDRRLMAEAILNGGYLADRTAAEKMTDELLAAQREYLPQFQ